MPEICLELQDRHGADVNVVLFCLWYAAHVGRFDDSTFDAVLKLSREWKTNVVGPLREVRRWLKTEQKQIQDSRSDDPTPFRDKVKALELQAEQLQQNALQDLVVDPGTGGQSMSLPKNATDNLQRYFRAIDAMDNIGLQPKLEALLALTFDAG